MPIITCPHCETRLNAPDSILGREVVCGRCQKPFTAKADAVVPSESWAGAPPAGGAGTPGTPTTPPSPGTGAPAAPPSGPAAPPPIGQGGQAAPSSFAPSSSAATPAYSPPIAPPPAAAPPVYATPPPPPPPGFPLPQQKTSGFAIASLVLGIASIVACMCYGVPSLICGILALVFHANAMRDINSGSAAPDSAGMARAGRICGIIGLVLSVGFWIVVLVWVVAH
jgi:hypothetical protein